MNTLSRRETIIQFLDAMLAPEPCSCSKPSECRCHVVDPSKTTILIFPCSDPKHSDSLIVKFNGQKFIAPPRKDKNGAKYWKARDFYEVEPTEVSTEEIKAILKKPFKDQTEEDRKKWSQFVEQEEKAQTIPCWECKAPLKIMGELDELAPLVCSECEKKKAQNQSTEANPSPEIKPKENATH